MVELCVGQGVAATLAQIASCMDRVGSEVAPSDDLSGFVVMGVI